MNMNTKYYDLDFFSEGNPLIYQISQIPICNKFDAESIDEEISLVEFFLWIAEKSKDEPSWKEIQEILDGKSNWAHTNIHTGPRWWEIPPQPISDGDYFLDVALCPFGAVVNPFRESEFFLEEMTFDEEDFASPADSGFCSDIEVPMDLIEKTFHMVIEQAEVSDRITRQLLEILEEKCDPPKPLKFKNYAARFLMKQEFYSTYSPFPSKKSVWKPRSFDLHENVRQACLYRPPNHSQNQNQAHLVHRMKTNHSPIIFDPNHRKNVSPLMLPHMMTDVVFFYRHISPNPLVRIS